MYDTYMILMSNYHLFYSKSKKNLNYISNIEIAAKTIFNKMTINKKID